MPYYENSERQELITFTTFCIQLYFSLGAVVLSDHVYSQNFSTWLSFWSRGPTTNRCWTTLVGQHLCHRRQHFVGQQHGGLCRRRHCYSIFLLLLLIKSVPVLFLVYSHSGYGSYTNWHVWFVAWHQEHLRNDKQQASTNHIGNTFVLVFVVRRNAFV